MAVLCLWLEPRPARSCCLPDANPVGRSASGDPPAGLPRACCAGHRPGRNRRNPPTRPAPASLWPRPLPPNDRAATRPKDRSEQSRPPKQATARHTRSAGNSTLTPVFTCCEMNRQGTSAILGWRAWVGSLRWFRHLEDRAMRASVHLKCLIQLDDSWGNLSP